MPSKQDRQLLLAAVLSHLFGNPLVVEDTDAYGGENDEKREVKFYL